MSKPNNSPEQKAAWIQGRRHYGSRFVKVHVQESTSGRKWKTTQGRFAVRVLQSLCRRPMEVQPFDGFKWVGRQQVRSNRA